MQALVIYTGVLQYMEKKVDSVGAHPERSRNRLTV